MAAAATRDAKEVMGYLNPNYPPGAGILISMDGSNEDYKKYRTMMVDKKVINFTDGRTVPGGLSSFDLETHGFRLFKPPPPSGDFTDRKRTREEYYPKLIEMAKEITGATNGYAFDYLIRSENPKQAGNAYSRFAHADAGPKTPPVWRKMLKNRWGVAAEEADSCEILMVNIWHPRERPAFRDPLCLLDVTTVDLEKDVVPIPYVEPDPEKPGEVRTIWQTSADKERPSQGNYLVGPTYNPNHRWVFCSDMQPDEAWMFKQYDTRDGPGAKCSFHNSFHDPFYDDTPTKPGRRSAEFRILLTFPKGSRRGEPPPSRL